MKAIFKNIANRIGAHWKTSLIGAVEGSGLIVGGQFVDPAIAKAAYVMAAYLFLKGLLVKDAGK